MLFSRLGTLCVIRADADLLNDPDPNDAIITTIDGIPNDGGDP